MRFLLALLLAAGAHAQGTGTLAGRITDARNGETLPGAYIWIEGTTLGAHANLDGDYRIIGVPVGTYTVTASYQGYQPVTITDVAISNRHTTDVLFTLTAIAIEPDPCGENHGSDFPFISSDPFTSRVLRASRDWSVTNPCVPLPPVIAGIGFIEYRPDGFRRRW